LPELVQDCVDIPRQVVHPPVQVLLEQGEARFGPLDPRLSGARCADADFGEALSLIPELTNGFLVQATKSRPFVLDQAFEVLEAAGRVALKPGGDVVPIAELRFKLADRERVTRARRGPLFHDVGASFGEIRHLLLDRVRRLSGEAIKVRLEIGQA
jgi:hypothetical protein